MDGFATVDDVVTVPLGGDVSVNVAMEPGAVAELVQVTSVPPPVSSTEASRNLTADEFGVLPIGRSLFRLAELSPGLTTNAPNRGQLTINGAFSYDNVFLVDGVDVNDNIFGTEINLFIEDTIEEAHVLTSGVSAEYGRFSGGVINIITKSGSNTFSGGFRSNLYKRTGLDGHRSRWQTTRSEPGRSRTTRATRRPSAGQLSRTDSGSSTLIVDSARTRPRRSVKPASPMTIPSPTTAT